MSFYCSVVYITFLCNLFIVFVSLIISPGVLIINIHVQHLTHKSKLGCVSILLRKDLCFVKDIIFICGLLKVGEYVNAPSQKLLIKENLVTLIIISGPSVF